MKRVLAALVVSALVAGCAGTRINWDRVRALQPGATADEIRDSLGDPYSITARGDREIWVWSHSNGMTGKANTLALIMKDGKLVDAPKVPDSF